MKTNLAVELLPRQGMVVIGLLALHLRVQPFLEALEMHILYGSFALAGLDLGVILFLGFSPAESAHVVFLLLRNWFDFFDFAEF